MPKNDDNLPDDATFESVWTHIAKSIEHLDQPNEYERLKLNPDGSEMTGLASLRNEIAKYRIPDREFRLGYMIGYAAIKGDRGPRPFIPSRPTSIPANSTLFLVGIKRGYQKALGRS